MTNYKTIIMLKTITDQKKIDEVLERGVEQVLPDKPSLKKILMSGKRIKLYQGFDPTGINLHIGHLTGLRKLRQFQDLGHEVVFLIGDGTGQAGDPSGKTKSREKYFNKTELRENAKGYLRQAGKVLRFSGKNKVRIIFNSKWLNKLKLTDILDIAENFSLQQLSERDIFRRRIKEGESVNLREFLYPLLQGYDSVAMGVDLEIGGSDQLFNMLAGRTLVKRYLNKEKFVLTTPLITDSSGRKIGKTEGNVMGISDFPGDLFGKIMSLSDELLIPMFENLTDTPINELLEMKMGMEVGSLNPKDAKERLAWEIVKDLNSAKEADDAQENFRRVFGSGGVPEDIDVALVEHGSQIREILVSSKLISSNTEFLRLLNEGAIRLIGEEEIALDDPKFKVVFPVVIKVGKKRFLKIELK